MAESLNNNPFRSCKVTLKLNGVSVGLENKNLRNIARPAKSYQYTIYPFAT